MKKSFFGLLIIIMLLTSSVCYSHDMNSKLVNKVIVIDPGHGGKDGGTSVNGYYEKDINLAIALVLRDELIKNGVSVLMTRDGDYDLSSPDVNRRKKSDFDNRIKFINESNADMYLSLHINYLSNKKYYGIQTFYTKDNEMIAEVFQQTFKSYLNTPLGKRKIDSNIYMYSRLKKPGLLIECGFLSNDAERKKLLDTKYQKLIASSIVKALIKYY